MTLCVLHILFRQLPVCVLLRFGLERKMKIVGKGPHHIRCTLLRGTCCFCAEALAETFQSLVAPDMIGIGQLTKHFSDPALKVGSGPAISCEGVPQTLRVWLDIPGL